MSETKTKKFEIGQYVEFQYYGEWLPGRIVEYKGEYAASKEVYWIQPHESNDLTTVRSYIERNIREAERHPSLKEQLLKVKKWFRELDRDSVHPTIIEKLEWLIRTLNHRMPGEIIRHEWITPAVRANYGNEDPAEKVMEKIFLQYLSSIKERGVGDMSDYHFILTLDRQDGSRRTPRVT